jgi:hypothetical protein
VARVIIQARAAYFRQRFAFKLARKKIIQAARAGQSCKLHTIFVDLFASRFQCASCIVTQEIIVNALRSAGMSEEELSLWEQFYTRMHERAFFEPVFENHDQDNLFKEALEWVTKLEKIL